MKKQIKYLVLSDIHLGHSINKTTYIVSNLRSYFKSNHNIFKHLDVIFIAGDTFDKLLTTSSTDFIYAIEWLTELVLYCKHNKIKLRILEGTPSHDWRQSNVIITIIDKLKLEVDFKYINTLHIEHMEDLGINVLYVPDEYKHSAEETYDDLMKLMLEQRLSNVDIAIMHGQFTYQLPIQSISSHNEDDYLSIVKYYISIGHIHKASVYSRILAQGSFDRLAHGEEEDKGCVLVTMDYSSSDNNYICKFDFIINKQAMLYKTYRFDNESLEDIIETLDTDLKDIKHNSNIRLISNNDTHLTKTIQSIKDRYPHCIFKIEKQKTDDVKIKLIKDTTINIESFTLTPDNLKSLLDKELVKYNLTKEELSIWDNEFKLI